jgi:hypothetical protein
VVRVRERGEKMFKRVWADLIEPVGEVVVVVRKGVVDGRTERVREKERRRECVRWLSRYGMGWEVSRWPAVWRLDDWRRRRRRRAVDDEVLVCSRLAVSPWVVVVSVVEWRFWCGRRPSDL